MKCQSPLVYVLLGVAALGLLLGVGTDVADALARSRAPLAERLQRTLDRAASQSRIDYTGVQATIRTPELVDWNSAAGTLGIDSDEPMARDSIFGIGSITKTFVATVVLQLVEENQVNLDALIGQYLPANVLEAIPYSDEITVRMLLNHTSGIAEWTSDEVDLRVAQNLDFVWELDHVFELVAASEPFFKPGEGYSYSNTDYTLLGMIIESITGNWWGAEVDARIISPLGLPDTSVRAAGEQDLPDGVAKGYGRLGGELYEVSAGDPSMAGAAGGNAILSTTSDLATFVEALLAGQLFAEDATLDEMLTWEDAPDDNGVPYWYGLGIEKYLVGGIDLVGHGGGAVGYSVVMYRSVEEDLTMVAANNAMGLGAAYMDLLLPMLRQL